MHSISGRQSRGNRTAPTDEDRISWLSHLRGAVMSRIVLEKWPAVLVTCSALKQSYRDELRQLQQTAGARTLFVLLATDQKEELRTRMEREWGHIMGPEMGNVQVDTLEGCREDEVDVVPVDAARSVEDMFEEAVGLGREEFGV